MAEGGQRLQEVLHVGPAGSMEVLGDLFGGERLIRMGHDGANGLGTGLQVTGPVERFRRRSIAAELDVEVEFGLRLDGLGGLVLGAQPKTTSSLAGNPGLPRSVRAQVADVAFLFLGSPLGVTNPSSRSKTSCYSSAVIQRLLVKKKDTDW